VQRVDENSKMGKLHTGGNTMTEDSQPRLPNIELDGPAIRGWWACATCCLLYLGEVSASKHHQQLAHEKADYALEHGKDEVVIPLPKIINGKKIRPAITIAGSVYFPVMMDNHPTGMAPMPVCWVHLQGYIMPAYTPSGEGK
jgi:hypothetical protein